MVCKNCGTENADTVKFCKACGEPIAEQWNRNAQEQEPMTDISRPRRFDKSKAKSPDEYFFTPPVYGETEPYQSTGQRRQPRREPERDPNDAYRPRKKGNTPYVAVSAFTAVLSLLQFALPFLKWFSYRYSAFGQSFSQEDLSLFDIVRHFAGGDNVISFFTGFQTDLGLSNYLPDSITDKFAYGRVIAFVIAGVFAVGLFLYLLFVIFALCRLPAAPGMGVSASIVTILASGGFLFAVGRLQSLIAQYDVLSLNIAQFSVTPAAYISIGLSVLIILLCITFSILDRRKIR